MWDVTRCDVRTIQKLLEHVLPVSEGPGDMAKDLKCDYGALGAHMASASLYLPCCPRGPLSRPRPPHCLSLSPFFALYPTPLCILGSVVGQGLPQFLLQLTRVHILASPLSTWHHKPWPLSRALGPPSLPVHSGPLRTASSLPPVLSLSFPQHSLNPSHFSHLKELLGHKDMLIAPSERPSDLSCFTPSQRPPLGGHH